MNRAGVVLLILVLVAPPAAALLVVEGTGVPAMRFVGNASFSKLTGIVGSGTANDPYIIQNEEFVLAPLANGRDEAAIEFVNTTAHVLLRHNVFISAMSTHAVVSLDTAPAIAILGSSNITIANNSFVQVGGGGIEVGVFSGPDVGYQGSYPAISVGLGAAPNSPRHESSAIVIQDNQFVEMTAASIGASASSIEIRRNTLRPYFDGHTSITVTGSDITLNENDVIGDLSVGLSSMTAAHIVGNTVVGPTHLDLEDARVSAARASLVSENHIVGSLDLTYGGPGDANGSGLTIMNNFVDGAGGQCGDFRPRGALLRNNSFAHCAGVYFGLASTHYLGYFDDFRPGADVDSSNSVDGRPVLRLHDIIDSRVDLSGIGFFEAWNLTNTTLFNASLTLDTKIVRSHGLALQDATFGSLALDADSFVGQNLTASGFGIGGSNITLRNLTVNGQFGVQLFGGSLDMGWVKVRELEPDLISNLDFSDCSPAHPATAAIRHSSFSTGLLATETSGVCASPTRIVSLHDSSLLGWRGLSWNGAARLDARQNWWGDASGPSPQGSGSSVYGNVIVEPWLTAPPSS